MKVITKTKSKMTIQDALQQLEMAITMVDAAKKSDDPEVILERAITRLDILRGFLLKNEF